MTGAIIALSWPILVESFLNSLVGLTDTYLAAQVSEAATDAIGGASYIMWFIGLVVMSVAMAGTALISRAVGASRPAAANAALGQAMLLGAISGVAVGLLVAACAPVMASVLSLKGEAREAFVNYLLIIATGVPAISILAVGISCARGAGDAVRPLFSIVIVNIANMLFSFLLSGIDIVSRSSDVGGAGREVTTRVLVRNPLDVDMGVSGIALGTVIGDYLGAFVILAMLYRGSAGIVLLRRRLKPHWVTIKRLVRQAIPSFGEMFGMWIGNFFIILLVSWIGLQAVLEHAADAASAAGMSGSPQAGATAATGTMGAHIIAIRIEAFSFLPGLAIGTAAATLVGQYLGAKAPQQARRAVMRCCLVTSVIMGVAGLVFVIFPAWVVSFISTQPSHLALAPALLFITGWVQVPFGLSLVLRSALRGAGDAKAVAYIMWFCTYGVRLPLAYALSGIDIPLPEFLAGKPGVVIEHPFFNDASLARIWIGLCIEIVVRGGLYTWRFWQGRWMTAKV